MFGQGGGHGDRIARLFRGAQGNSGCPLNLGTGVLDGADQPGRRAGRFPHRQGGLFGRRRDFRCLAQHPARCSRSILGLFAQRFAQSGRAVDFTDDSLFEQGTETLPFGTLRIGLIVRQDIGHQACVHHGDVEHDERQALASLRVIATIFPYQGDDLFVCRGNGGEHRPHRHAMFAGVAHAIRSRLGPERILEVQ